MVDECKVDKLMTWIMTWSIDGQTNQDIAPVIEAGIDGALFGGRNGKFVSA